MKIIHPNHATTEVIGFIDLGATAIPHAVLATALPGIARFERCLPTACYITGHAGDWLAG
ncbi:MAG TPA: hypothetical protein VKB53_05475 [Gammaproteobacteria bacterium]|nr:hypothetical protein [Gammaproteobacteria bacterium]HKH20329.1 hypothetical protein [Gammaproteobacteria bacterium]